MNHLEMEMTFARNGGRDGILDRGAIDYLIRPGSVMLYGV